MNFRNLINQESNYGDLDRLFSKDFEIDAKNDFPLMYLISYKIHQDRYNLAEELSLSEDQQKIINYALAYDYSPETKIVSSYVYHQLKKNGISEKFLDDFRRFKEASIFRMQGIARVTREIPNGISLKIWDEYGDYPKLNVESDLSLDRMLASEEKEKYFTISKDAKNDLTTIHRDFQRNKYVPNSCPENWQNIDLRGLHNFSCALMYR